MKSTFSFPNPRPSGRGNIAAESAPKSHQYGAIVPIVIIEEEDGSGYFVLVPTLPGCFSQGATIEEAQANAQEAITLHLRALKKSGKQPRRMMTYQTMVQVSP